MEYGWEHRQDLLIKFIRYSGWVIPNVGEDRLDVGRLKAMRGRMNNFQGLWHHDENGNDEAHPTLYSLCVVQTGYNLSKPCCVWHPFDQATLLVERHYSIGSDVCVQRVVSRPSADP